MKVNKGLPVGNGWDLPVFSRFLGSDKGPEVGAVKELREADHWTHADPSRVWRQNDEKGNGGDVWMNS